MSALQFHSLLLHISSELSSEQLAGIKFLCPDIKKREQEKIDSGLKLFEVLRQRGQLDEDNTDHLCWLLQQVRRHDLSDKLKGFDRPTEGPGNQPGEAERAKLDVATDVIAENLGKNWRRLGRRLGLSETKLDSISKRNPTELDETAVNLLREWRKSRGAEARTGELIQALRDCDLNLTADKLEQKLATR